MRRLLADPFTLGSELVPREAPTVPPETVKLRAAKQQLEQGLQPASGKHMKWCINKLSVLPAKDGSTITAALYADNFLDVFGDYPEDLWSTATLELLQTKTFRPTPAEMREVIGAKFAERRRMLDRVKLMLGAPTVKQPAAKFVPEPEDVRLRAMRDSFRKVGQVFKAAGYERKLAEKEQRDPETWALEAAADKTGENYSAPMPTLPKVSPEVEAQTLFAVAKGHRKQGNVARAEMLERQARALAPQLFEPAQEHRDVAEAM